MRAQTQSGHSPEADEGPLLPAQTDNQLRSSASISRCVPPVAWRHRSSSASRIPGWSRRSSPTWMRKRLSPKPQGGSRVGRRPNGGCSNKGYDPTKPLLGLRRQGRCSGGGCREGQRCWAKDADEPVAGGDSDAVTPLRADGRVGATAEPPNADTDNEEEKLPAAEGAVYTADSPL